jgi:uncharacterized protein
MMAPPRFIDANVFLFARLDAGAPGDAARALLRTIDADHPATTSVVVLNEVLWNLRKPLGRDDAIEASRRLARMPGLKILPIGERSWTRALGLMAEHPHLKPNDALHAACALEAGIATVVSTDADFDGIPGLRRKDL